MTQPSDELPQLHNLAIPCQGAWVEGGLGKVKCHAAATHAVRLHMLDHCNVPGLDGNGNRVVLCCGQCRITTAQRVATMVTEMLDGVPNEILCPTCRSQTLRKGDTCRCGEQFKLICRTCGKDVVALHDLFEVEAI